VLAGAVERARLGDPMQRADDDDYRSIIEQAVDGHFVADASGRYVDVNEAGARLLGMSREEILARSIADVVVEDEHTHLSDALARVFAGDTVVREWRFKRKDGSVFFGEVGAKLLSDGRVHGLLRDVTLRKRGEIALRQSEERFRMLTDAAFEGIGITEDGRIVEVNDQLASMLGYERDEVIGMEVSAMIAPQSRDAVRSAIDNARALPYEHIALRKDGSTFPVEVRGKMVELAGRRLRMTAVRDITERRRMEDALQSMVAATSTIGQQFFRSLVRETASSIGVRCALIAALRDEPDQAMQTIAVWADGAPLAPFAQPLAGSACAELLTHRTVLCDGDAQERFANDEMVRRMNARSLLGVALLNANGAPIGALLALHDRPLASLIPRSPSRS
jgi:PAS domain S-box-containing protein